jgi:diguanylate cyclase (GGDEF)-like protein
MRFAPELEAAYRNSSHRRQLKLLRLLVMFPAPLLVLFVYLQGAANHLPFANWLTDPLYYALLAVLLVFGLWMRQVERSAVFAWAGVVLISFFALCCALMTVPGQHDNIALMLPLFIASPMAIAPFWARVSPVVAMLVLSYLASSIALVRADVGSQVWVAYLTQACVGGVVAIFTHKIVDAARRGHFISTLQLEQSARIDALTSLLNRRHFMETGESLVAGMRSGDRLCACFLDLDHFKRLNDEGGHRVGDMVLVEAARQLQSVGGMDRLIGRLGGEEFALLLPGMSIEQALDLSETLRGRIADIEIDGFSVRASVGVAQWQPGESLSSLLHRADLALLAAKRAGRDRIQAWTPGLATIAPG